MAHSAPHGCQPGRGDEFGCASGRQQPYPRGCERRRHGSLADRPAGNQRPSSSLRKPDFRSHARWRRYGGRPHGQDSLRTGAGGDSRTKPMRQHAAAVGWSAVARTIFAAPVGRQLGRGGRCGICDFAELPGQVSGHRRRQEELRRAAGDGSGRRAGALRRNLAGTFERRPGRRIGQGGGVSAE